MSARFAHSVRIIVASSLLTFAASCSKESSSNQQPTPSAPSETMAKNEGGDTHAPSGVKPGSHEDWCAEHEVPESQCTRCNPELIPAFKATNDWCEEHQLPLSQDKIHNPDLVITRPPKGS